jgi:hypothetical protein
MSLKTRLEILCSVGTLRNLWALEPDSDFIATIEVGLMPFAALIMDGSPSGTSQNVAKLGSTQLHITGTIPTARTFI